MPRDTSTATPSRRAVLVVGGAVALTACTVLDSEPAATPALVPHPDDAIRERVAAAERDLIAQYSATITEHPALTKPLTPFQQRHERHLSAIENTASPTDDVIPTPQQPQPSPSAPSVPAPSVPDEPAKAIRALRDAESAAAGDRLEHCLSVADSELASLLAGVAACETTHDRLLRRVARDRSGQ